MNIEMLKKSGLIVFEAVAGSKAYGTANKDSDEDIRGLYLLPREEFLKIQQPLNQVSDEKNDVTFYEMRRFFELASGCNPNILELLWLPEDCIRVMTPTMEKIIASRDIFLSLKAFHTFNGYAYSQIQRAKGQNKWVNNRKPVEHPSKLDFCWFIDMNKDEDKDEDKMPCRPVPLAGQVVLSECHAAKLEHVENTYRLYHYGPSARGVFRGEGENFAVESIPYDDEKSRFVGLLVWNEQAYEAAMRDWKNYWTWKKERNEARYRIQEAGEIDYDSKNMCHCMRLLLSGRSLIEGKGPIVRFEGDQLQMLRDIRAGVWKYDTLMERVNEEMVLLEKAKDSSTLRHSVNMRDVENLYESLRK